MKKVLLFSTVIAAVSFTSCKKDRTCTCKTTDKTTGEVTTDVTIVHDSKKKDARLFCLGTQTTSTTGSSTYVGDDTVCELK